MTRHPFLAGPLLLDAALGTELARRGADTSPPLWSARAVATDPDLVLAIHRDEVEAGADIVTAATFRTHRRDAGSAARALTERAVALAREAAALRSGVRVAGSLAPLEDCWRPDLVPADAELAREHAEQAEALAAAGVDLILVETVGTAREWLAATRAATQTGLPVVSCAAGSGTGTLLSGEPFAAAVPALLALPRPPAALGVNCVAARRLGRDLASLAAAAPGLPLAAYGNTGLPLDERSGLFSEPIGPDAYAACAATWLALGALVVGGCCGTRAVHTQALRRLLDGPRVSPLRGSSRGRSSP